MKQFLKTCISNYYDENKNVQNKTYSHGNSLTIEEFPWKNVIGQSQVLYYKRDASGR